MWKFLKELLSQTLVHGKMLVGYFLIANPWLTDYPTLLTALQDVIANPSRATFMNAIAQAVLALGASHRLVKILQTVMKNIK